ncbi:type I polyketide synthase, partial [Frankia sp. CpI1-P]
MPGAAGGAAHKAQIVRWLTDEIADRLQRPPESVDANVPMVDFGLDSADLIGLLGGLEDLLGADLEATLAWEHPTIAALADHVGSLTAPAGGADEHVPTADPAGETDPADPAGETDPADPAGETDPADDAGDARARWGVSREPIAIVGIGCRFPGGADGPESFWRLLREGRDAVTEVPADRWDATAFEKITTRWGGFVDGIDRFDPHFFGISPQEAARMDPQQRLLAEVAWEALEDAGVVADQLAGSSTGVFVGVATNDYGRLQFDDLAGIDAHAGTGSALSIAANRLSYLFDLRGPSLAVDTACSSSLVAVLQACASLARGECSLALAGGVNAILSPAIAINFSKAGAMAADGRCKAFDERADGYVRSEGAGIVVLKPLRRAIAEGDRIYAVVRGGAVNQDGR